MGVKNNGSRIPPSSISTRNFLPSEKMPVGMVAMVQNHLDTFGQNPVKSWRKFLRHGH
jgi:hypothetical protein